MPAVSSLLLESSAILFVKPARLIVKPGLGGQDYHGYDEAKPTSGGAADFYRGADDNGLRFGFFERRDGNCVDQRAANLAG